MKTYQSFNFEQNLIKLRSMAKIIKKNGLNTIDEFSNLRHEYIYDFIIILHNFLIVEHLFQNEISDARYELNSKLNLSNIETKEDITIFINYISSMNHQIRHNIEAIPGLRIIHDFIEQTPEIYELDNNGNNVAIRMKNGSFNYLLKNIQVKRFKI